MENLSTAGAVKRAIPDFPIVPLLADRWSPYGFADREVSTSDLRSLFEAARWAASSYNEQPWNYIVATKDESGEYERLFSCLVPGNQAWAKTAPVLVLCVVSLRFVKNNEANRAAAHDLGLATGNLVIEATARGLSVHQMIGILPEQARTLYGIPPGYEAWTAMAIGYKADPASLPQVFQERDLALRRRKPLGEFVFTGRWGHKSPLVIGDSKSDSAAR